MKYGLIVLQKMFVCSMVEIFAWTEVLASTIVECRYGYIKCHQNVRIDAWHFINEFWSSLIVSN